MITFLGILAVGFVVCVAIAVPFVYALRRFAEHPPAWAIRVRRVLGIE